MARADDTRVDDRPPVLHHLTGNRTAGSPYTNCLTISRKALSVLGSTEFFRLRKRVVTRDTSAGREWMAILSEARFPLRTDLGRKVIPIPAETHPMIVSMVLRYLFLMRENSG